MSLSRSAVLLYLVVAATLVSLAIDVHLTRSYGGVDLRDKVVGSRSLLAGRSLYYDPWSPGDPEELADPMLPPGAAMTRYTGTPFQALLLAPLAKLPYGLARWLWLLAQYALLFLAVWLAGRTHGTSHVAQWLVMAGVLLLFLGSRSWHLHVERGQVYVIAAALIGGLFATVATGRAALTGVLATALLMLKPTYAVVVAPLLWVVPRRAWWGGMGALLVLLAVFAVLPGGLNAWAEYRTAMTAWGQFIGRGEPPVTALAHSGYPATIEGISGMDRHHPMEFEDGSIAAILHAFGWELPGWMPGALFVLLVAGVMGLAGRRMKHLRPGDLLLMGFCGWTVLMWLLPVPRFDYQVVHWAAPLTVLLLTHTDRPFAWNALAVVAAALLLGAWPMLPVNVLMAEMIMVGLVGAVLWQRLNTAPSATSSQG
jgi:hypothetical protein